jgi:hypothetical protein
MTSLLSALLALSAALAVNLEGQVIGPDNQPVPHAQVFLEPGLGGQLMDVAASDTGHFVFSEVQPGAAGVFAVAPGMGFAGQHLNVAVGDVLPPIRIVLQPAVQLRGRVVDPKGGPIQGARVTRFGVKGVHKVGIPLAKLKQFGYLEPVTDADGRFVLDSVSASSKIDLKIGHPNFAQEGVIDAVPGAAELQVSMHPGVLVEGEVVTRATQVPIAHAAVLIQNAQPPHDTATASSSLSGNFSLRLKPGVYLYQAQSAGMRSAGWERLTISGERPVEKVRLAVAGFGTIRGNVRDAVSGNPIRNIRITLATNGIDAAVVRTGPGGDFQFTAGEGENSIIIDSTPGYFSPDTQQTKVTMLEGTDVELPGMWLRPLPAYQISVVREDGSPVPGALVTLLRPSQLGWHVADDAGLATIHLQNFPESGSLLGRVEDPSSADTALFTLEKTQAEPGTVQLFTAGTVAGRVVNSRGRAVSGASVGAFFPGEDASGAILLWQTYSDKEGTFRWNSVVPGVPQRLAARASAEASGESATFNLAPAEVKDLGDITVEGAKDLNLRRSGTLKWYQWPVLCGALPADEVCASSPALLVRASAASLPATMESLARVKEVLNMPGLVVALIAESAPDCGDSIVPVLSAKSEGAGDATTLLLDRQGQVVLETGGLPPVAAIRGLQN